MQILILGMVFVGIVLLLVGTFAFVNRRRLAASDAARTRLRATGMSESAVATILRDERVSDVVVLDRLLSGKAYTGWVAAQLARAGSRRKPGELTLTALLCGALFLLLGRRLVGMPGALVVAGAGVAVPFLLLRRQQAARFKQLEEQLPDALEMLVNALRAGYSLQAAMEFVGREMAAPLGPEFARFYDEQRLGIDVRTALVSLQHRVGTQDISMFVTSLLIQRESGGNLAEVLGNLAALMRERVAFRGAVATLTAEPKMSAYVLVSLPIGMFSLLWLTNRTFLMPLLTTPAGQLLLLYAVVSVAVGYAVMMKIAKVDI